MRFHRTFSCALILASTGLAGEAGLRAGLRIDARPIRELASSPAVSYADALELPQKAVVALTVRRPAPGAGNAMRPESLGSGVVVTSDGYIVSNYHVVAEAQTLEATLPDGRSFLARVVGSDPKTDIAVLKIDAEGLDSLTLGDSDQLRVGDVVFAVGNPLNLGQTVTMGIVSARGRRVGVLQEVAGYENFIQTDAAINQGNSGGALVDAGGRLVGINTAILSGGAKGASGIGFAIPSNFARSIMLSLVESGRVERGYLGVHAEPLSPEVAEKLGLARETRGVMVTNISNGGPADEAGIQRYDVLLTIEGRPVVSTQELRLVVSQIAPGTVVAIRLMRNGRESTVGVRLGRLADETAPATPAPAR